MALASLIVAILAFAAAGAAAFYARVQAKEVGRQTAESRRQFEESGPQVSVSCHDSDFDAGGIRTRAIAVTARNAGRGPVTVSGWGLSFRADDLDKELRLPGQRLQQGELTPLGPAVPCELGGLNSLTWKAPLGAVAARLRDANAHSLRPYVTLGTGEERSGEFIWLPPES
jgi:hypothetical protein